LCANPVCCYLVHSSGKAGKYCCGLCWYSHEGQPGCQRAKASHGAYCERMKVNGVEDSARRLSNSHSAPSLAHGVPPPPKAPIAKTGMPWPPPPPRNPCPDLVASALLSQPSGKDTDESSAQHHGATPGDEHAYVDELSEAMTATEFFDTPLTAQSRAHSASQPPERSSNKVPNAHAAVELGPPIPKGPPACHLPTPFRRLDVPELKVGFPRKAFNAHVRPSPPPPPLQVRPIVPLSAAHGVRGGERVGEEDLSDASLARMSLFDYDKQPPLGDASISTAATGSEVFDLDCDVGQAVVDFSHEVLDHDWQLQPDLQHMRPLPHRHSVRQTQTGYQQPRDVAREATQQPAAAWLGRFVEEAAFLQLQQKANY